MNGFLAPGRSIEFYVLFAISAEHQNIQKQWDRALAGPAM
jgi:hypothetical protein